jgi:hypothetical protein
LVGFLWRRDQLVTEAALPTQQTRQTSIHALSGILTRDARIKWAADRHLKPLGNRDWLSVFVLASELSDAVWNILVVAIFSF